VKSARKVRGMHHGIPFANLKEICLQSFLKVSPKRKRRRRKKGEKEILKRRSILYF
jgi:hypothetical protein